VTRGGGCGRRPRAIPNGRRMLGSRRATCACGTPPSSTAWSRPGRAPSTRRRRWRPSRRPAGGGLPPPQAAGGAAGRVADARDLCVRDPQLAVRGHFVDVPVPEGGSTRIDGPAFLLSETPGSVRGPGPLLGEHTREVLATLLGMDRDAIAALRDARIVGGRCR